MNGKKGQGLQINVIVLLVLALITIIVILMIFNKQIFRSEEKIGGVSDPLEIKSRCLQTWKQMDASYDDCIDRCMKSTDPKDPSCFYG